MKYLMLNTHPKVAIPLEALAACGAIRILQELHSKDYNLSLLTPAQDFDFGGRIIDDSQILRRRKAEAIINAKNEGRSDPATVEANEGEDDTPSDDSHPA